VWLWLWCWCCGAVVLVLCVQAKLTKNPKGYTLWCKELL